MTDREITAKAKFQPLTGFSLKLTGVALMVVDHIYEMFASFGVPLWFHMLGRACMPIFLFMAAEGFHYTHSKSKYMLRLLIGFWVMGIGNIALSKLFPIEDVMLINNVFGTIFLSVFYIGLIEMLISGFREKRPTYIVLSILGMAVPVGSSVIIPQIIPLSVNVARALMLLIPSILLTEGGFAAVLLAITFYLLRRFGRTVQMIPLGVVSVLSALGGSFQWMMVFAAVPILMYNGEAGKKSTWFFYIFYPAHIYAFYMVSYFMR